LNGEDDVGTNNQLLDERIGLMKETSIAIRGLSLRARTFCAERQELK
jgi:hypothetical protein